LTSIGGAEQGKRRGAIGGSTEKKIIDWGNVFIAKGTNGRRKKPGKNGAPMKSAGPKGGNKIRGWKMPLESPAGREGV